MSKINMSGSTVGAKALCGVVNDTTGVVLPLSAISEPSGTSAILAIKKPKGVATLVHDEITTTATSTVVNCIGYNSLLIFWESSATDKTWTIQVLGSTSLTGTYVPWITSAGLDNTYTTDISGFFIVQGIPDYVKIVATETDNGATVSCTIQPLNL